MTTHDHLATVEQPLVPDDALTDQQSNIVKLTLRGLSQSQIASVLGVSQPYISQQVKKIRAILAEKGGKIHQDHIVGVTRTVYEEVEQKAWELFYNAKTDTAKNKALNTVLTAREKHIRLLMDIGKVQATGATVEVKYNSPILDAWADEEKRKMVSALVSASLSPLAPPVPPQEEPIDAEFEDNE